MRVWGRRGGLGGRHGAQQRSCGGQGCPGARCNEPAAAELVPSLLPHASCCPCSPVSPRYILWAAEEEGYDLPYACRLGCCTACTVKVKEGEVYQPHSLGLSKNLRDQVGAAVEGGGAVGAGGRRLRAHLAAGRCSCGKGGGGVEPAASVGLWGGGSFHADAALPSNHMRLLATRPLCRATR